MALAVEGLEHRVLARDLAEPVLRLVFAQRLRQFEWAVGEDAGGDRGVDERIQRRVTQRVQHLLLFSLVGANMTGDVIQNALLGRSGAKH